MYLIYMYVFTIFITNTILEDSGYMIIMWNIPRKHSYYNPHQETTKTLCQLDRRTTN